MANVYLRPHDFAIRRSTGGEPALQAIIVRINAAGALARLTLKAGDGSAILAELPLEELRELDLREHESVFLCPKQARVFLSGQAASETSVAVNTKLQERISG